MLSSNESHGSAHTGPLISSCPEEALVARYRELGYELGEQIGHGRSGAVHRGVHVPTGIEVAIKRLHAVDPKSLRSLKREFRTLFRGQHHGIAKVYELVLDPIESFFTMELIDGPELVSWVRRRCEPNQVDQGVIGRVIDAMSQLAVTLSWLHQSGRVHRDVKPTNIRVQNDRVVLLDFDLAALAWDGRNRSADSAGTLPYMPNEAVWEGKTSTAADVYALGVLGYECLTAQCPFRGPDPIELHRQKSRGLPELPGSVPAWLDALLRRMTSCEPFERPTAAELAVECQEKGRRPGERSRASAEAHAEAAQTAQRLVDAYHARNRSTPTLFCLSGPSRVGKTFAVSAFLDRISADSSCEILEGSCLPSVSIPFQGVDAVVDALAEHLSSLAPDEVEPLVPAEVADLLELFPALERVAPFQDAPRGVMGMFGSTDRRLRAFAGLKSVLEARARVRSFVVVVDDLQWADEPSLRFWADMLAGTAPFVFVAVARSRQAFNALQLGHGGIHLDLELKSKSASDFDSFEVRALSPTAQRLLQASSLAFAPIDLETLGSVVRVENSAAVANELIRAPGLIRHAGLDPRMTISPYDEGIRRKALALLSPRERRALHRTLAEVLSTSEGDAYAIAAFWHWLAADEPETASSFAARAGARLMKRMAFEQAASLYEAALAGCVQCDSVGLTLELAQSLAASGKGRAAAKAYARAACEAERHDGSSEARRLRRRSAESFLRAGYVAEGTLQLDRALGKLPRSPRSNVRLVLFLLKERARRLLAPGRIDEAGETDASSAELLDALWTGTVGTVWADLSRSMYYQALHATLAARTQDPVHRARAKSAEGCYLGALSPGLFGAAAERLGNESLRIAEAHGDPDLIAMARCTAASTSFLRGDWATTIKRCESIVEWVDDHCGAADWELSTAYLYSAWSLGFRGDLRAVESFRTKVLERGRAHDDRLAVACVSVGLPNLTWLARGRPDLARVSSAEAMRQWRASAYSPIHFFALLGETLADLYDDDPLAARARFQSELPLLRRSILRWHPIVRPLFHYLNATTALAALQRWPAHPRASHLRRRARISCWRLRLERAMWSRPFSRAARASWDSTHGRFSAAADCMMLAEQAFRRADMGLYAEAARYQRAVLRAEAEPSGFSASVADPKAMARCLIPIATP